MSPKERFDACMKQAEFYYQQVYNRQGYQWKVTIGLWTVLLASTGFLMKLEKRVHIPECYAWTTLAAYSFLWVRAIAFNNRNNQRAANHFRDEAEALMLNGTHVIRRLPEEGRALVLFRWCFQFMLNWSHRFEVVATGLIILAAMSLLNSN